MFYLLALCALLSPLQTRAQRETLPVAKVDKDIIIAARLGAGVPQLTSADMWKLCSQISKVFHCNAVWYSGAVGNIQPSAIDSLYVSQFIEQLRNISGSNYTWTVTGDQTFSARTDGSKSTLVADASSTSEFSVETEFFPFNDPPPCKQPAVPLTCSLGADAVKVQRHAPAHLVALLAPGQPLSMASPTVQFTTMGSGVDIYIVDGNIAENNEFDDLVGGASRLMSEKFQSPEAAKNAAFTCSSDHGTNVASLAAGVSYGLGKNASVYSVAVQPGCGSSGRVSDLARGLTWILERLDAQKGAMRPSIVSMSLQLPGGDPSAFILTSLVGDLIAHGAIVVAAAGNYAADACDFSPSGIPDVIAVGALESTLPWSSSNIGKCVTLWAPGVDIVGASPECFQCTATFTGTSQAAPIVAGLISTYLEAAPTSTVADVKQWLLENAITLDNVAGDSVYKAARYTNA